MRPRRHIFHHSEPPPPPPSSAYQSMSHNNRVNQAPSPSEQSMAPPPPLPMGHHSAGPSATPPHPDFIAELIRLGLNPEDMMSSKQSSNPRQQPPTGQEEALKNLQALLGKRDVAELIQKLQPNDWSSMAQQPPSDYSRVAGGSSGSVGNPGNRDSVIRGPAPMFASAGGGSSGNSSGSGVGASGTVSFTNNINNNGNSSHHEQDIQYANMQHQQQHFRIPTATNSSNTTMQSSPYYRQMPTGSQSEQMKSILSRYRHQQQQQKQQHPNDPTYRNRVSNQQQQHISNAAAPNLPFANLSDLGGSVPPTSTAAVAASGSGGTSTILDTSNNPNSIFSHHTNKTSPALSSYTIASGGGGGGGSSSSSMAARVPTNLMDALSGGSAAGSSSSVSVSGNTSGPTSGIDINMHDNSPFQLSGSIINNNNNNNNSLQRDNMKQKSIARHQQQLRGQLRANNDKLKNYLWTHQQGVSSSSLSHGGGGGDMQSSNQQPRPNQSINNTESMSQMRRQLTSPLASAISPSNQASPAAQSTSSVPKSLLNLAAFSTSPPTANNINALASNPRMTPNQVQAANRNSSIAAIQTYGTGVEATFPNNRQQQQQQPSAPRTCSNSGGGSLIQKASTSSSGDLAGNNQLLQQMIARSTSNSTKTNPNIASRTNYSNYSLSSLLSDDQSNTGTRGNVSTSNIGRATALGQQNPSSNSRTQNPAIISNMRRPPSAKSDDAITAMSESKDLAKIAYLEESLKRSKATEAAGSFQAQSLDFPANSQFDHQVAALLYNQQQQQQQQSSNLNSNEVVARKEIESALKRVENRNDLSLLYPPIALSSNSQKQVNSLSAGLQLSEDVDVFTDEVKKIVQEGCNIIYECKTCCNLFRSLANLVKHKRAFCKSEESEATARFELTRRANMSALQSVDLSVTKSNQGSSGAPARPVMVQTSESSVNVSRVEVPTSHHISTRVTRSDVQTPPASQSLPVPSLGSQKYNLRGKRVDVSALTGEMRAPRMPIKNPDNRHANITRDQAEGRQTNLSRLLQSQPRNRPQVVKDSPLMEALSIGTSTTSSTSAPSTRSHDSTFYKDHVRNSSLAKTLLSESARSMSGVLDQSTHMMARETNNNMQQSSSKRPLVPKRKLLEDCIRKVKRDKLGPDEDPNFNQASEMLARDHQQQPPRESDHQFRDPLDMDDSGADSDALVMDLDDDNYPPIHETRRTKSRPRTSSLHALAASTSSSSSQSNSKLNSSSALLKALTKPVESMSSYGSNNRQKVGAGHQAKEASTSQHCKSQLGQDATSSVEDGEPSSDSQAEPAAVPPSPLMSHCSCDLCERSFSDPSNLIEHIFEKHPDKEKYIYPCIFCSLSFIALENVCRHMVDIHKKSKAQVNKLKDVVQSRSHVSEDFENCNDVPAEHKTGPKNHSTKPRLSPSELSDSAATQQILDDTVALVSMAASPTKFMSTHSPTKKEAAPSPAIRSSTRLSASESDIPERVVREADEQQPSSEINIDDSEQGSQSGMEIDDRLSDSMIPCISDEQLAILEREEAEIEAERLRREEELHSPPEDPSEAGGDLIDETGQHQHRLLQPSLSSQKRTSVQEPASSYDSHNWRDEYQRSATKNDSCGKAIVANEPPSRQNDNDDEDDDDEEEEDVDQDEQPEDTKSMQGSSRHSGVSRGKHMVPPVRRVSEEDDEEEDDDDDDDNENDDDDLDEGGREGVDDNDEEDVEDDEGADDRGEVDSELAVDNDDEDSWSVPDDGRNDYSNHQSTMNDLSSSQLGNSNSDDEIDLESHRSRRGHHRVTPRRRSSHGSSTKGDHNSEHLSSYHNNQHETNDKSAHYDHDAVLAAPRASSTSTLKSKHKHGTSRETSTGVGGASSASSSGGGTGGANTPGSSGGGGGIMKLKIQLKKQPDEKNQVYRIVE